MIQPAQCYSVLLGKVQGPYFWIILKSKDVSWCPIHCLMSVHHKYNRLGCFYFNSTRMAPLNHCGCLVSDETELRIGVVWRTEMMMKECDISM